MCGLFSFTRLITFFFLRVFVSAIFIFIRFVCVCYSNEIDGIHIFKLKEMAILIRVMRRSWTHCIRKQSKCWQTHDSILFFGMKVGRKGEPIFKWPKREREKEEKKQMKWLAVNGQCKNFIGNQFQCNKNHAKQDDQHNGNEVIIEKMA